MSQPVRKHSHFILDAKKQEQRAIKHEYFSCYYQNNVIFVKIYAKIQLKYVNYVNYRGNY